MKYLLFLPLLAMVLTTTVHSQELKTTNQTRVESNEKNSAFEVEKVPVYPGCSGENNEELKRCMMSKIMEYIGSNFNTDIPSGFDLTGRQRINVMFVIDSTGKVVEITAEGPHSLLELEAIRVMESLPQMEAGEQEGKKVSIQYALPIVFDIEE